MQRKLTITTAAATAVLALVAAGCGGGGKKGYALTKAEYAAALDKICADFNAAQEEIGSPESLDEIASKGSQIVEEFDKAVGAAKALTPPDELKDTVDSFLNIADEQRGLFDDLIEAAEDGDGTKVQEIGSELSGLDTQGDELANEIGATECTK